MFTSSIKCEIRHFPVVMAQGRKEMHKKARCTCRVAVLSFSFSSPSWYLKVPSTSCTWSMFFINPLKTLHLRIAKIITNTYLRSATIDWAKRNILGVNTRFFFKVAIYFRQGGPPCNFSLYIYIDLFWRHLGQKLTYESSYCEFTGKFTLSNSTYWKTEKRNEAPRVHM